MPSDDSDSRQMEVTSSSCERLKRSSADSSFLRGSMVRLSAAV